MKEYIENLLEPSTRIRKIVKVRENVGELLNWIYF